MQIFQSARTQHREIWDLLPWLTNGTLNESDTRRCESHLQECAECAAEYRAQQALHRDVQAVDSVLQTPHASLRKLMAKIEAEPAPAASIEVEHRPHRVKWLAAAVIVQTVGLMSLAGFMTWKLHEIREQPRYGTLSSVPAALRGPLARVVFDKSMPMTEVADLLRSHNAQIIAGPTEAGVYTLQFADETESSLPETVARLRQHARVRFAEVTWSGPPQ